MRERNLSIDMFRGITMLLMVFVNEFWKVLNVPPHWLEHFATLEDGMGLSDIVFPMFLFAMGMSVPYALERRQAKGYSTGSTLRHILGRTLADRLGGRREMRPDGHRVHSLCLGPYQSRGPTENLMFTLTSLHLRFPGGRYRSGTGRGERGSNPSTCRP